jgi:hypothetical protein
MTATGETDLTTLLRAMQPDLDPAPFVFVTATAERARALWADAVALIREAEGITVILTHEAAQRSGFGPEPKWARITLTVHSSLSAVGFMAAISARLAAAGLSLNPLAGYFHDHLFVPWERREEALTILRSFQA